MPVRNTLTLLRLALIRYAVFEEWPNACAEPACSAWNYR